MTWQRALAEQASRTALDEPGVESVEVTGSLADPDAELDAWSDVDLRVVLAGGSEFDGSRFVARFGTPWALTTQTTTGELVHRVVYDDGRRLDLVVVTRGGVPLGGVRVPRSVAGAVADGSLVEVRQAAALAVAKLARDDLLIGMHLALELVQHCLEQAMVLHDRELGTTSHRTGGPFNEVVARLDGLRRHPWTPAGGMALVREAADVHDELAVRLDPSHVADWSGLDALLRQAGR